MDTIRVGVIGLGVMGAIFCKSLRRFPQARVAAVADPNAELARRTGETYAAAAYADYREMLGREELDAVLVCTPDQHHLEPTLAACKAGLHVFLEKPLATEVGVARKIAGLAAAHPKTFMVGHTLRFDPRFVNARESVRRGDIGELLYIRSWRESCMDLALRMNGRCSTMFFTGVHDADIMLWCVGCRVERVYAESVSKKLVGMGINAADAATATFRFENGVIASLTTSWVLPKTAGEPRSNRLDKGMEIVGDRGVIEIEACNIGVSIQTETTTCYPDNFYSPDLHGSSYGVYSEEMHHFLDCVRTGREPVTNARDALAAVELIAAVERSLVEGRPVQP